jgi:hypothetical protein
VPLPDCVWVNVVVVEPSALFRTRVKVNVGMAFDGHSTPGPCTVMVSPTTGFDGDTEACDTAAKTSNTIRDVAVTRVIALVLRRTAPIDKPLWSRAHPRTPRHRTRDRRAVRRPERNIPTRPWTASCAETAHTRSAPPSPTELKPNGRPLNASASPGAGHRADNNWLVVPFSVPPTRTPIIHGRS